MTARRLFLHLLLPLACLAALSAPQDSAAQTHYESRVSVGGHGGATFSKVFFHPAVRQKMKPGATFGASFRYVEETHFGLIAELNFAQQGWKENFEEAPYSYSRTLNYVEIPVMAHIYFGHRGHFFFNAGPQIGFLLGESTSANFNPSEMSTLPDFPVTNRTNPQMLMEAKNKIDYGICAGMGGEFFINPRNSVYLEVRAYYGLGNIFSAKRTDTFSSSNQLSVVATLGYWFRFK